jgi:hypothetical protein
MLASALRGVNHRGSLQTWHSFETSDLVDQNRMTQQNAHRVARSPRKARLERTNEENLRISAPCHAEHAHLKITKRNGFLPSWMAVIS